MHACCQHLLSRRALLRWTTLAPAVSLGLMPRAHAATTEALLLSCMDFRLMDDIERYMHARGLREKYDHIVLAGASLGAVTDRFPAWNKTFWDHLGLAIQLHQIERVIVIDHRDCGAYRMIVGEAHASSRASETAAHGVQLRRLREAIGERHRHLAVETLLMSLDGSIEVVG
ncbi:hypothetical protein CCO03_16030 [Comamonas serinivorans]|uniref:Carbonic anhydrase n=1 Tax=Comamonas serinivorans TaxID=1082851 RepID=A0A1Y0EQX2_9BURK|nr:carbonic anhydrase [Comamonas serinivorans]ARU05976.1 hypothetical protein CCO03_16030 [Comamonas serinivorans]